MQGSNLTKAMAFGALLNDLGALSLKKFSCNVISITGALFLKKWQCPKNDS
jgi:hypothetical protein